MLRFGCLIFCCGLMATPAHGQQKSGCGWDRSLESATPAGVSDLLAKLESSTTADSPGRDAARELMRWFAECDEGASRRAVSGFRKATLAAPDDPLMKALYAVALARGEEVQPVRGSGYLFRTVYHFSNAERDASRLFHAVALQTAWTSVGLEAAALALASRHETSLNEAAEALQSIVARNPDDAAAWTALAEVHTAREDTTAAIAAGQRAASGDTRSSIGLRSLGVAGMNGAPDDTSGARIYIQGLSAASGAEAGRFYEDIRPLLSEREIAQWHALPPESRGEWLTARWTWRASQAGISLAGRLATHHRRVAHAMDSYMRTAVRGPRPQGALRIDSVHGALPFQDQGLIYIRHGEPDAVVNGSAGPGGERRVAWIYLDVGTDPTVIEFRKMSGYADFVAAGPQQCDPLPYMYGASGPASESKLRRWMTPLDPRRETRQRGRQQAQRLPPPGDVPAHGWEQAFERDVLDFNTAVAAYAPGYGIAALRCVGSVLAALHTYPDDAENLLSELDAQRLLQADARTSAQNRLQNALRLENASPVFSKPLRPLLSIYSFREDRGTSVVAFVAVPGGELIPSMSAEGAGYALNLFMAVENPATESAARMDTTLTLQRPSAMTDSDVVRAVMRLDAPPSERASVRVGIYNGHDRKQGGLAMTSRAVPAYGDRFAVSDIVIAEPDGTTWQRGSVRLSPIPGHLIAAGAPYRMFYEIYGASTGDEIRTTVTIAPAAATGMVQKLKQLIDRKQAQSVQFNERVTLDSDGVARSIREIGNDLVPGDYVLESTLRNNRTGAQTSITTTLRISR